MDNTNIILTILSSSLLSASLTATINWVIQKNNYKNDYYKKLLEKRLNAYDQVGFMISELKSIVRLENGELCNLFFTMGKEYYDKFCILNLIPISMSSFWLNEEISDQIRDINILLLHEIDNEVDKSKHIDAEILRLGVINRDKIVELRIKIEDLMLKDFKDLHNIKSFVKSEKPDKKVPIYTKK